MSGSEGVGGVHRGPFPRNGIAYHRNKGTSHSLKPNPALSSSRQWHTRSVQQFAHLRESSIRKRPVTGSVRIDNNSRLQSRHNQVAKRSTAPADYHYRLATPVLHRTTTLTQAKTLQAPKVADGQFTKPMLPRRGWGGYMYNQTHTSHVSGNWYYTINPLTSTSLDYHSHPTKNPDTACMADDSIVQTGYYFNKKTKQRSWTYPKPLLKVLRAKANIKSPKLDTDSDSDSTPTRRRQEKVVRKINLDVDLGHSSGSYGKAARGILSSKQDRSGRNLRYYLNKKLNPHEYPAQRKWKV